MTVAAWPMASEAPNPVIVWNVVAPLIVAVLGALAAYAGRACAARASVAATATAAAATGVDRLLAGTSQPPRYPAEGEGPFGFTESGQGEAGGMGTTWNRARSR